MDERTESALTKQQEEEYAKIRCANYLLEMIKKYGAQAKKMKEAKEKDSA